MTISNRLTTKIESVTDAATLQGQTKFITNVMEWENCTWEEAQKICHGETEPIQYEYTLGYKLSDPVWVLGMTKQVKKKWREEAIKNFEKMLCPEELEIFRRDVINNGSLQKEWKSQYKKKGD